MKRSVLEKIIHNFEDFKKNKQTKLTLNDPKVGTFVENFEWHSMCCSKNSIILTLAERKFSKKDYFKI
jgi:hypothetical protein